VNSDPFSFSAPRFTGPCRHAGLVLLTKLIEQSSTSPRPSQRARPCLPGSVMSPAVTASACLCTDLLKLPVLRCRGASILKEVVILIAHYAFAPGFTGMQGLLEKHRLMLLPYPSAGWPGAKTVRMHGMVTKSRTTAKLKQTRPSQAFTARGSAATYHRIPIY